MIGGRAPVLAARLPPRTREDVLALTAPLMAGLPACSC